MLVPGLETFPNPLTGTNGGFNDQDRSLLMTWDLPVLSSEAQDHCLDYIASIGHTHVLLSRPHGLNMGMTLGQLAVTALKCKARGLFVIFNAVSDGDSFEVAVPWLDHLLEAGAMVSGEDSCCFCWQVDRYYAPPDLCRELISQSDYCKPRGIFRWVHWLNGACAWWTPADENDPNGSCELYGVCDRWGFQAWAKDYLNGHLGQLDHNTELDQLQSNDAKVLASLPHGLVLCCAEQSAQGLYDRPNTAMALYGTQKGRYLMASHYGAAAQAQIEPMVAEHTATKKGLSNASRKKILALLTHPLTKTRAAANLQALQLRSAMLRRELTSADLLEAFVDHVLEQDRKFRLNSPRTPTPTQMSTPVVGQMSAQATAYDPPAGVMSGGYLNDACFDDGSVL